MNRISLWANSGLMKRGHQSDRQGTKIIWGKDDNHVFRYYDSYLCTGEAPDSIYYTNSANSTPSLQ